MHSRDRWTETLYRFVEHYRWEPQHLCIGEPLAKFHRKLRSQEVPLNFLLNMTLNVLPSPWLADLVEAFDAPGEAPRDLRPRFPHEIASTQPDVLLEGAADRVFIECKVEAAIDLQQLQKYSALHAALDETEGAKRPWLLLLTKKPLAEHWKKAGDKRELALRGVSHARELLRAAPAPDFLARVKNEAARQRYPEVAGALALGYSSWQAFGTRCQSLASCAGDGLFAEPVARILAGLLEDLKQRGLWA